MPTCQECKSFFPIEENPERGDCVQRGVDPRQSYYTAREVDADKDASECSSFQKKQVLVHLSKNLQTGLQDSQDYMSCKSVI